MIRQKVKNFNLWSLKKTKVTASSGLILIMSFAKEIGLAAALDKQLFTSFHSRYNSRSLFYRENEPASV